MSIKLLMSALVFVGLMSSCVSSKKYKTLQSDYDTMKSMNKAKMDAMKGELKDCNENVAGLKTEVGDMKRAVMSANAKAADSDKMAEKNAMEIKHIKAEIKKAFAGSDNSELSFSEKGGNLYVSLANQVLYKPGHADLNHAGRDIIAKLAEAFKTNENMQIVIEGHTDSDRIRRTRYLYKDNWDLSAARATNVVRELVKNGVSANQLTAAGRGDAGPAYEGEDGKNMARRIEFVLKPDAGRIYKLAK